MLLVLVLSPALAQLDCIALVAWSSTFAQLLRIVRAALQHLLFALLVGTADLRVCLLPLLSAQLVGIAPLALPLLLRTNAHPAHIVQLEP